jgi:biopolymer transport protein ExbB
VIEPGTLLDIVQKGGPTMVFMVVVSVLVLAVGLERLAAVGRFRRDLRRVDERVVEAMRRGEVEEARRLCESLPSPLREVFASALDRALGRVRGDAAAAMNREQRRAVGRLRSFVWTLGTAGALMPFVGLFGTVVGVMGSFRAIGVTGTGGFAVVSAGISEALVATAAGLFVALEAVSLYNGLQSAIAAVGRDLGLLVDESLEILHTRELGHARTSST